MKKFLCAGLLGCALFACPVRYAASAQKRQPAKTADPCPNARTDSEMSACAAQKYKQADAELNRVYQELMRAAGAADQKLKTAQLAWLKFRDAECDYQTAGYEGDSMRPMVYNFCLADVTTARTKQLRNSLNELQEDK